MPDKTYVHFVAVATPPERRTKIWTVMTTFGNGISLGQVKWYVNWRKYCFYPSVETLFDPACLRAIADFCEQATKDHKEKL